MRSRRQTPHRHYIPVVFYVPEGKTENIYINRLKELKLCKPDLRILYSKPSNSSVKALIDKAKTITAELKDNDVIWILIDEDTESHTALQMDNLEKWSHDSPQHFFALSVPRFETCLLMHFVENPKTRDVQSDSAVSRHIPGYSRSKSCSLHCIDSDRVRVAQERMRRCSSTSQTRSGFYKFLDAVLI